MGGVTGEKSKGVNLDLGRGSAFWVKEGNKINKENSKLKQK